MNNTHVAKLMHIDLVAEEVVGPIAWNRYLMSHKVTQVVKLLHDLVADEVVGPLYHY